MLSISSRNSLLGKKAKRYFSKVLTLKAGITTNKAKAIVTTLGRY